MATLLHIKTSLFGDHGQSAQLAKSFVDTWLAENSDGVVIERDLASDPVPHLDAGRVTALNSPAEERDADQRKDFQVDFVKQFLAFIGLKDTRLVLAEGLAMDTHRDQSLEQARAAFV